MEFIGAYKAALLGLFLTLVTIWIQGLIASLVKARQPGAVPGFEPQEKDHSSFIFRAYRTHLNSLENIIPMLGASIICVLAGANVTWTTTLIWVYAVSRLIHMVLYYVIATNKNPSPRSWFFLTGFLATLGLFVLAAGSLL